MGLLNIAGLRLVCMNRMVQEGDGAENGCDSYPPFRCLTKMLICMAQRPTTGKLGFLKCEPASNALGTARLGWQLWP